jgi:hypothetical protein
MGYCQGGNPKGKSYQAVETLADIDKKKWCPGCKTMKHIDEFYMDPTRRDMRKSTCMKCSIAMSQTYQARQKLADNRK